MQAGAVAGRIRYSREMELEADQLATYIVHEAGYDLRAARKLFIRMARAEQRAAAEGQRGLVGFLKTHPTDAWRTARRSATSRLIEAGQQRPESIESVAEREGQERLVAKCERFYREYPECPGWGKSGLPEFARLGRMTKGVCPFTAAVDCTGPAE